jgi:hypothetical protein
MGNELTAMSDLSLSMKAPDNVARTATLFLGVLNISDRGLGRLSVQSSCSLAPASR